MKTPVGEARILKTILVGQEFVWSYLGLAAEGHCFLNHWSASGAVVKAEGLTHPQGGPDTHLRAPLDPGCEQDKGRPLLSQCF
jgi:hypothetical protein